MSEVGIIHPRHACGGAVALSERGAGRSRRGRLKVAHTIANMVIGGCSRREVGVRLDY